MPGSRVLSFTDPYPYQSAIRAGELEVVVTTRGAFRAELTQVDFSQLWMQRGRENLPRILRGATDRTRASIGFLTDANAPTIYHCGREVSPHDIVINDSRLMHRRTEGPCRWGAMSLTPDDLAAAGRAIAGRDLSAPSHSRIVRPSLAAMERLVGLHNRAGQLAETAPGTLARPQVAKALEQSLIHAMITCLDEGVPAAGGGATHRHAVVIARLEEFLTARKDEAVYLAEICTATGVSERTLRACCQEALGMGAIRYLWLRRMHLAHRALILADAAAASVTEVATAYGFWELGRFSTEYRALFGEPPSVSLHRPPGDGPRDPAGPLTLAPLALV